MSNSTIIKPGIHEDSWKTLKQFTSARIALGRTGAAIPLKESLAFKLAHANARDAVFSTLNKEALFNSLQQTGLKAYFLESRAESRIDYLQRPDLGRRLKETSAQQLKIIATETFDVAIVIADGLSATAINKHVIPVLRLLLPSLRESGITTAPITIIEQARVAIADEVGFLLQARLSLILIGERPGLSSPHSMGCYLTYAPKIGLTDESRNCISNIHAEGLIYEEAAKKIFCLIKESLRLQLSGVQLKAHDFELKDEVDKKGV